MDVTGDMMCKDVKVWAEWEDGDAVESVEERRKTREGKECPKP